ncbi:MAG: glycosyltransferase family 2 protein [Bacteroides sp.]|nr:glycosyltransferase family 2 protein [Bacteroides sp.]
MKLTIFTPTYNRAYLLQNLYKSLSTQTNMDFEWIIVDDGSTDNTKDLVDKWIKKKTVKIKFFQQENGGKHRAINKGVKEAKGDLFFIVDSDDTLTSDAVEWITRESNEIIHNPDFAGISGIRITPDGKKIGGGSDFGTIDCNSIEIRLKYHISGDMSEVYKTSVLKEFPFPEIKGEKFCPEALVWFRIARKYKMRFIHRGIYVGEYLPDGLTAKITRIRRESPIASSTFYAEHFHDSISLKWKFKAAINFWRFQRAPYNRIYRMLNPLSLLGWLPGKIMRWKDSRIINLS